MILQKFCYKNYKKILFIILGILFVILVLWYICSLQRKYLNKDEISISENNISISEVPDRVFGSKSGTKEALFGDYYIDERWANFQFCPDVELNYFGTEDIEMDTYDRNKIIRRLHTYEEKEGVFYTLDNQSRFYSFRNSNEIDTTIDIGEEAIVRSIDTFLKGKIEDLEDYEMDNIKKIEDCYKVELRSSADDTIDLEVKSDGNIQSMFCRYNDGKELSDEEKQYFVKKLDNYIKEYIDKYVAEYKNHSYSIGYQKIDEEIYAFCVFAIEGEVMFVRDVVIT